MKKLLIVIALLAATLTGAGAAFAADEGFPLDRAPDRTDDLVALQHGAQLFVNYCLNCHSANLVRYRALEAIGIPQKAIENNLLFTTDKVGDTMSIALRPSDAKAWFGAAPPDLSVEARARGADWLYTYLRSFYLDPSRPTGWNNMVYPNVAMPNVLWQLQGEQEAQFEKEAGEAEPHFAGFRLQKPGTMSPVDYDSAVADLVSYLSWMAEPAQKERKQLGVWVLLFLGVFSFMTWRLNAAYWKDIE